MVNRALPVAVSGCRGTRPEEEHWRSGRRLVFDGLVQFGGIRDPSHRKGSIARNLPPVMSAGRFRMSHLANAILWKYPSCSTNLSPGSSAAQTRAMARSDNLMAAQPKLFATNRIGA
jgi:hypothetical protein